MKMLILALSVSFLAYSCSSTVNKNSVNADYEKALKEVKEEAEDADTSFNNGKFTKYYSGDKKIKKVAIISAVYGVASSRSVESGERDRDGNFKNVIETNKKDIASWIYDATKAQFENSAGYEIISPSELAEKSPTFKSLGLQDSPHEWNSYPTYYGIGAQGSRHLDGLTHSGKKLSQIATEAGIDAVIQIYVNEVNSSAKEGYYQSVDTVGFKRESSLGITVCVPREKAKADGASLGWFGDANFCGGANVKNNHFVYFPETNNKNDKSHPEIAELAEMTSSYQKKYFQTLVTEAIKELKEEGL